MSEENKVDFGKIEQKWQKKWEEAKVFEANRDEKKKKFYVLEMFPYPSGAGLHMGHAFNYIIGDIFARFKAMQGFNVLHPMGYDSLGLPAENAAIKEKTHPEEYTNESMKNFMNQQKKLGLTYDWTRIVNTADSDYYKWDQWIFLKMFEKGLVYEKEAPVNWCPKCNTIISNEQAQGGECERCGSKIEIKNMNQWFLKITNYADRLLEGHKKLNWPEKTIAMQKNWIGKSHGTEINFQINEKNWPIFTTRPDTIFGVTFMVVSAQHPKLNELVSEKQKKEVEKFLKK
jgi:leucyl-tRNA synthetase